jgi:hypothetical protein
VSGDGDDPSFVARRKVERVTFRGFWRRDAIGCSVQNYRRNTNGRFFFEQTFNRFQRWIASCIAVAMSVRLNRDLYKIRIFETSGRSFERCLVEEPVR